LLIVLALAGDSTMTSDLAMRSYVPRETIARAALIWDSLPPPSKSYHPNLLSGR